MYVNQQLKQNLNMLSLSGSYVPLKVSLIAIRKVFLFFRVIIEYRELDTPRKRVIMERYKTLVTTHYKEPGQNGQFDDCTSYSPRLLGPQPTSVWVINRRGKKRGSVTYGTDREDEVSKIFIIFLSCLKGSATISIHQERLQISEAGRKQNESI